MPRRQSRHRQSERAGSARLRQGFGASAVARKEFRRVATGGDWRLARRRVGVTTGNTTVNVLPFPTLLSTETVPPCASTMAFTRLRPRPRPRSARLASPRNRRSQMRGSSSARNAGAGIADAKNARTRRRSRPRFDMPAARRVLQRVVDQVRRDLLQPYAIGGNRDVPSASEEIDTPLESATSR